MSEPLETLESSLGVDPVLLDPPETQDNDPYLQNRPTLASNASDDDRRPDDEVVFPANADADSGEDRLDRSDDDSLSLETAVEDDAAMLRSGRSEDFSEVDPLDDDHPETLHPIL